ncbi:glycosyltransferase family 4 protein [uncultured Winogradskyella sp.]|uniref:glycosyltransferase family 4 protein n=1 Tax=uncultured Winogradskyella sp. TaxID=395353 RepID=UPI0026103D02|nr:glycosyltransferase family 4 protein [uncultured Winogradskyella sp.]
MNKNLKIAIYSGDIPSTTFIERLIVGLSGRNCHIFLFGFIKHKVSYNKSISVFAYKNTKFHKAIYLLKYSSLLFLFKNKKKRKLDNILKKKSKNLLLDKVKCYPVLWHKPDIFHVQWAKGIGDWVWVKEFGIKLVLSLRGAHINYSPIADQALANMYKEQFPKVDAFHAVSKAIGKEAGKYGASKDKVIVVYSGVPKRVETLIKPKQNSFFKIISIGRPHWVKGYSSALDSCKLLKEKGLEFQYTIVGGKEEIELAYQVHDLNLENEVILLDTLPYSKVQENIANSDLLLLPSVKEGIANVVLEAMSLNTLVLSTDCGGITEVIKDGKNGFIVPIRDPEAMANKIIMISDLQTTEKKEIREKALKTIVDNHSEQHMADGMLALYKNI